MSERNTTERLCDNALVRCRRAFAQDLLPTNIGDLVLAMDSDCITVSELEYIESLVGQPDEMQVT
jgi:hypothetical protein